MLACNNMFMCVYNYIYVDVYYNIIYVYLCEVYNVNAYIYIHINIYTCICAYICIFFLSTILEGI